MKTIRISPEEFEEFDEVLGDASDAANRGGTEEQQEALSRLWRLLGQIKAGLRTRAGKVTITNA